MGEGGEPGGRVKGRRAQGMGETDSAPRDSGESGQGAFQAAGKRTRRL